MKRFLCVLAVLFLTAYFCFSLFGLSAAPTGIVCEGLDVKVKDSLGFGLLDNESVGDLLKKNGLEPTGKELALVNLDSIEGVLMHHPLVLSAQCFKTVGRLVHVNIKSCVPLVRVFTQNGSDYLVDNRGRIVENCTTPVNIPVATGYITRRFASEQLPEVVYAINASDFWRDQVEQIYVDKNGSVCLVPRVGNHLLYLGNTNGADEKLDRLMKFYQSGLQEIGWNKYSSVSAEYDGQIVCKKR